MLQRRRSLSVRWLGNGSGLWFWAAVLGKNYYNNNNILLDLIDYGMNHIIYIGMI